MGRSEWLNTAIPESISVLSVLVFGALGVTLKLKRSLLTAYLTLVN
ncbi:hypothetical protein [Nostoc sp.]